MATARKPPPVQVLNAVCPVCGTAIQPGQPLVELPSGRKQELLLLVHVCSGRCADLAARDPERHVAAARESRRV